MNELGCLICGENMGFLDNGEPCWGCNFTYCKKCGLAILYNIKCCKCETINEYKTRKEKCLMI